MRAVDSVGRVTSPGSDVFCSEKCFRGGLECSTSEVHK